MVNDPWLERLLRRPEVRARLQIFIRIVGLSSFVALAAGVILLVLCCVAGM